MLKLSDGDETEQDTISGSFGLTDAAPGTSFQDTLQVKNVGTARAKSAKFDFDYIITEGDPPGDVDTIPLPSVIKIESLTFNGTINLLAIGVVDDLNGNGYKDLEDLANTDLYAVTFSDPQTNNHPLYFRGILRSDQTVNQHQGDSITLDVTITLSQEEPP